MLSHHGTYRVPNTEHPKCKNVQKNLPNTEHPRCKNVQKNLPYTLQENEGLPLRPDEWMCLHKVRIANNVYTGMMDTCNIQISVVALSPHKVRINNNVYTGMMDNCNIKISMLASHFMLYHSSFLSGNS